MSQSKGFRNISSAKKSSKKIYSQIETYLKSSASTMSSLNSKFRMNKNEEHCDERMTKITRF